jgi:hypothetical protein
MKRCGETEKKFQEITEGKNGTGTWINLAKFRVVEGIDIVFALGKRDRWDYDGLT